MAAPLRPAGQGRGQPGLRAAAPPSPDVTVLRGQPPHLMFVLQTASRGCRCCHLVQSPWGLLGSPPTLAMQEVPLPSALPASLPGGDCRAVLSGVVAADVLDDSAVHRQVWCERWACRT